MTRDYEEKMREVLTEAVDQLAALYGDSALEHLQAIYFEALRRIQQEMGPL